MSTSTEIDRVIKGFYCIMLYWPGLCYNGTRLYMAPTFFVSKFLIKSFNPFHCLLFERNIHFGIFMLFLDIKMTFVLKFSIDEKNLLILQWIAAW